MKIRWGTHTKHHVCGSCQGLLRLRLLPATLRRTFPATHRLLYALYGCVLLLVGGCGGVEHHTHLDTPSPVFAEIYFPFDQEQPYPREAFKVFANARWLESYPEIVVLLEGHTDVAGPREYNVALGDRRARAVAKRLLALGLDPSRLVGIVSRGEEVPATSRQPLKSRRLGHLARRVRFHAW